MDGTGWIYDLEFRQFAGPEVDDEMPPLPAMADLHAALQQPVDTVAVSLDEGLYRLRFAGEVTTETGIVGQDLTETFYGEVDQTFRASGPPRSDPGTARRRRGRGQQPRGRSRAVSPQRLCVRLRGLGLLRHGDINTEHSWTYLEGDLSVGSEYSLQLVPDLADDVWLYGQAWSVEDREIAGTTWRKALEYMYVVDLGIQIAIDPEGHEIGYIRSYLYGSTVFVPEVGPVACHERHVLAPE